MMCNRVFKAAGGRIVSTGLGQLRNNVSREALAAFRRDEAGSVTAFSLFIFLMMLFVGGMAVDLMRFETRRASLQNTLDASALAATNLRSDSDAEQLVKSIMSKVGYDPELTNVVVEEVYTGADPDSGARGTLVARSVRADYDLDVNTIFMPLLGIESLGTTGVGGAKEGMQTVEISLVLDISGSMAGSKMSALKTSAKSFVNAVIDPDREDLPVTISIVPFNHTVVVPDSILDRLNTTGTVAMSSSDVWRNPNTGGPYVGALTEYARTNTDSKCVRFMDDELMTNDLEASLDASLDPNYLLIRAITTSQELDRMAYYRPDTSNTARCDDSRSAILPFETDIGTLEAYIGTDTTGMQAGGNTSNDTGLKWGVALLDPAFRSVVTDMVDDDELPDAVNGRPYDYNPANFMKVLVLMTDGANTTQFDLDSDKKVGPSRVWFSQDAADATGKEVDGYYVLMPNNSSSKRFMRPHELGTRDNKNDRSGSDAELVGVGALPSDAQQLSYTELYSRLSERDVSYLFYDKYSGDYSAYYEHYYAEDGVVDGSEADERMSGSPSDSTSEYGICDVAKVNNDIIVYTIAFQAGEHAEGVMRDCATSNGYYFNAANSEELNDAFEAIAGSITKLRLTQ